MGRAWSCLGKGSMCFRKPALMKHGGWFGGGRKLIRNCPRFFHHGSSRDCDDFHMGITVQGTMDCQPTLSNHATPLLKALPWLPWLSG